MPDTSTSIISHFGETPDGKCSRCKSDVLLVTSDQWKTDYDGTTDDEWVEPCGEVSGHWCRQCNVLTAVFVHTPEQ